MCHFICIHSTNCSGPYETGRQAGGRAAGQAGGSGSTATVRRITFPIRTTSEVIFFISLCFLLSCYHVDGYHQLLPYKSKERKTEDFVSNLC